MDKCPKCNNISLVFDPYSKMAKCLRIECTYREAADSVRYSSKFQSESKELEQQLSLSFDSTTLAGNK